MRRPNYFLQGTCNLLVNVQNVDERFNPNIAMATRPQDDTLTAPDATRLKQPPLFKVILLNDDYTPMDFVVHILQQFFGKTQEQATQIMLQVHHEGRGMCGLYPADIAATKVAQVTSHARQHQHPLQCVMEEN